MKAKIEIEDLKLEVDFSKGQDISISLFEVSSDFLLSSDGEQEPKNITKITKNFFIFL